MTAPTPKFSARKMATASAFLAGVVAISMTPTPAYAQIEGSAALNILRECAKIGDSAARLSCFDNNIRNAGPVTRSAPPRAPQGVRSPAPTPPSTPSTSNSGRDGFGREDIRTQARFELRQGELSDITARIVSARQRQPGIYVFTLEDGAEWIFSETVSRTYRAPRAGSEVVISRGSLGSFLMRLNGQQSVSVRRVR